MSVLGGNPLLIAGDDQYQISRSVRLRSSASASFTRTPASAGNKQKMTWSFWLKPSLSSMKTILGCSLSGSAIDAMGFDNGYGYGNERFHFFSSGAGINLLTARRFRDPSAWYHFVVSVDTTQATNTNRVKIYVNGVQETAFDIGTYPALNANITYWNSTSQNWIGNLGPNYSVYYSDVYLTELNFIDGQALTPSSFGETDAVTGVWKPKKYAGTYGTNGFYLNFSDNSAATATAIGKDYSGNGNNWTPNNISVTSGSTYDSMLDVPTLWADGGNGRGNYCTLNPLNKYSSSVTVLDGNLGISTSASNIGVAGTIGVSTSQWYWETTFTNASGVPSIGAATATWDKTYVGYVGSIGYHGNGVIYNNGSNVQSGLASYTSGDVIGVALDLSAGSIKFYKNNVQQGTTITGLTGEWFPAAAGQTSSTLAANFGQRPFAYTPPTGFKALNTQNLPEATIKKGNAYFDVKTYTGNGSSQTISGLAFSPDLVWQKSRSGTGWHNLVDQVRGAGYRLFSNTTNAESYAATNLTSFTSDGFTIGSDGDWNTNASSNVTWQWKESASAGFDIVTWTGDGTSSRNINHNLGVAPKMIISKSRTLGAGDAGYWDVYHASLASQYSLFLHTTGAAVSAPTIWPSAPTSTYFTVGSGSGVNVSGSTMVAYLFAEVAGFSKFGSYTGNGSADGPFVFTNFRPKFVLMKRTDTGGTDWIMWDSLRNTYNVVNAYLAANLSDAETTAYTNNLLDFVSNGFKVRQTASGMNASGGTYIYAAFAENPFKNSLAR